MRRERRGWTERYERRQEEEEEEERQKDGNEGRKRKRQHRRKIQGRKEGLDTIRSWFSADVWSSQLIGRFKHRSCPLRSCRSSSPVEECY